MPRASTKCRQALGIVRIWSCISEEQDSEHGAIEGKTQTHMTEYYNLDVIISVGYRVKSKRGVEFRRWANSVLKKYILQGYAVNDNRIAQLGEVIRVMKNRKLSGMEVNTK